MYCYYSNSVCKILIIHLLTPNMVVILIYRPSFCRQCQFTDIVDKVGAVLSEFSASLPHIMLLGYLNFPGVNWDYPIPNSQLNLLTYSSVTGSCLGMN